MKSLEELYKTIEEKSKIEDDNSYTWRIFQKGIDEIAKKLIEESGEVAIAAIRNESSQDNKNLTLESVDLLYHLMALLVNQGVSLEQIEEETKRRLGHKKTSADESYR